MTIPNVSPLERARKQMRVAIDAGLATEIGLINTEAGDITIPTAFTVMYHEAVEESPTDDGMIVEILNTELSAHGAGGATVEWSRRRLTSEVIVEVGIVLQIQDAWTQDDFADALDRLGSALVRAITMKNISLSDAPRIMHAFPSGRIRYEVDTQDDPSGRALRKIVVPFEVKLSENL